MSVQWYFVKKNQPPVNMSLVMRPVLNEERNRIGLECLGGRTITFDFPTLEEAKEAYNQILGLSQNESNPYSYAKRLVGPPESKNLVPYVEDGKLKGEDVGTLKGAIKESTKKPSPLSKCKGCGKRKYECECEK